MTSIGWMLCLAQTASDSLTLQTGSSVLILLGTMSGIILACKPVSQLIARQEEMYATVLRGKLLIDIKPRTATIISSVATLALGAVFFAALDSFAGGVLGVAIGSFMPFVALKILHMRRLRLLETQLVNGIQTLSSGVRAGLNLVQSMELIARDGAIPIRQGFAHLLREYQYGVSLEEAMGKAARRIGSSDYRLLFAALQTHRQRGGDLGETLDRIADSIREIQRLENRVKALTAQPKATARWLSAMPLVVITIMYFLVDSHGVRMLFTTGSGKLIVVGIVLLNTLGFIWVRKIASVDV